uniref:SH3 domain-containing protein n=1 Tax=Angiostrongylus cantonensis TaxID=6313 RepID=A0A0K0DL76_ANGCA
MVLRPSSSSWSVTPETIMSHHYKLAQGIKGVVDTSPPFSMYNSPISVHYVPKRASSADAIRRRQSKLPRPHRELVEFIGEANPPSLRLPLPLKGIDVKPKILQSRNYQPPLHRNRQKPKPPVPPSEHNRWTAETRKSGTSKRNQRDNFYFDLFKDAVYSGVIDREAFTDGVIIEVVESEMEKWCGQISWDDLEYLRGEIFEELGMHNSRFASGAASVQKKESKTKTKLAVLAHRSSTSTGSRSDTPTSSSSSLSEVKSDSVRHQWLFFTVLIEWSRRSVKKTVKEIFYGSFFSIDVHSTFLRK